MTDDTPKRLKLTGLAIIIIGGMASLPAPTASVGLVGFGLVLFCLGGELDD